MKLEQALTLILVAVAAALLFLTIVVSFKPDGTSAIQAMTVMAGFGGGIVTLLGIILKARGRNGDRDPDA